MFKQLVRIQQKQTCKVANNASALNKIQNFGAMHRIGGKSQHQQMSQMYNQFSLMLGQGTPLRYFGRAQLADSKIVTDFKGAGLKNDEFVDFPQTIAQDFKYADQIEDYHFDSTANQVNRDLKLSTEELKKHHVGQYMAYPQRKNLDFLKGLQPNELMLTNFPQERYLSEKELMTTFSDEASGITPLNIRKQGSMVQEAVAYMTVEYESVHDAMKMAKKLKKTWIDDKLIKVRTMKDRHIEHFDNRTVVMKDIPTNIKVRHVLEFFKTFGVITNIEMPLKDSLQEAEEITRRDQQADISNKRSMLEATKERLANKIIKDSLEINTDYVETLEKHLGTERAQELIQEQKNSENPHNQYDVLDGYKAQSFAKIIVNLQKEFADIQESRLTLNEVIRHLKYGDPKHQNMTQLKEGGTLTNEQMQSLVTKHKDQLEKAVSYMKSFGDDLQAKDIQIIENILKDKEQSIREQQADPIQELLQTQKEEIGFALDTFQVFMKERVQLVEHRLMEILDYRGVDQERVFHSTVDWDKETEQIKDFRIPYPEETFVFETFAPVNQQIYNIKFKKEMPQDKRIRDMLLHEVNPFKPMSLEMADLMEFKTPDVGEYRAIPYYEHEDQYERDSIITFNYTQPINKDRPFTQHMNEEVKELMKVHKKEQETPFDEIFQEEKEVIQKVVICQLELDKKTQAAADPHEYWMNAEGVTVENPFDNSLNTVDPNERYKHFMQEKQAKMFDKQLNSDNEVNKFQFSIDTQDSFKGMLDRGLISQAEYDNTKKIYEEARQQGLGYAFVTFSHVDECKKFLDQIDHFYHGTEKVEIMLKSNLDHQHFDQKYMTKKLRADALVVEEMRKLREAKRDLRKFERKQHKEQPKESKLKELRQAAKDLIENEEKRRDVKANQHYTKDEKERLHEKMKKLMEEHPDLDLTQLYDSETAEKARKALHKKAFASYKAYQFLKNGVDIKKDKYSQYENIEAVDSKKFEYPDSFKYTDSLVSHILTSGIQSRIADQGQRNKRPGRKFKQSFEEIMEHYAGPDYMRAANLENEDFQTFQYRKAFRDYFKKEDYLIGDDRMEENRDLGERFYSLAENEQGVDLNPQAKRLIEAFRHQAFDEEMPVIDFQHPRNKKRTILTDFFKKIQELQKEQELIGRGTKDTSIIEYEPAARKVEKLKKEYFNIKDTHFDNIEDLEETVESMKTRGQTNRLMKKLGGPMLDKDGNWVHTGKDPKDYTHGEHESIHDEFFAEHEEADDVYEELEETDEEGSMTDIDWGQVSDTELAELDEETRKQAQLYKAISNDTEFFKSDMTKEERNATSSTDEGVNDMVGGHRRQFQFTPFPDDGNSYDDEHTFSDEYDNKYGGKRDRKSKKEVDFEDDEDYSETGTDVDGLTLREKYKRQFGVEVDDYFDKTILTNDKTQGKKWAKHLYDSIEGEVTQHEIEFKKKEGKGLSNPRMQEINNQFMYEYDFNDKKDERINDDFENQAQEREKNLRLKRAGYTPREYYELNKKNFKLPGHINSYGGQFYNKARSQVDEDQLNDKGPYIERRRQAKQTKSIDQFIDEVESGSERDEDELFQDYQNMIQMSPIEKLRKRKEELKKREDAKKLEQLADDTNLKPSLPSLEEHLNLEQRDRSYFDDDRFKFENEVDERQRMIEELEDEEMYRRELLSRLYGKTLSNRQFDILMKYNGANFKNQYYVNHHQREKYYTSHDRIRLYEEELESLKRKKIMEGEWTQEDAEDQLRSFLHAELDNKLPPSVQEKFRVDFEKYIEAVKEMEHPERILEREYHFDEDLGESVDDHVERLKQELPQMEITTRRDHDNYPIVSVKSKKSFKYDISQISSTNPEENRLNIKKSGEQVLKTLIPGGIDAVQNEFAEIMNNDDGQNAIDPIYDFDSETKQRLQSLVERRVMGDLKQNDADFLNELISIKDSIQYDYNNEINPHTHFNLNQQEISEKLNQEMFEDRDRLNHELQDQLTAKTLEFENYKKRKQSDLVNIRQSEKSLYDQQVSKLDDTANFIEKHLEREDQDSVQFDEEAYKELKERIRERRAAKERLLHQGFPDLKPYANI